MSMNFASASSEYLVLTAPSGPIAVTGSALSISVFVAPTTLAAGVQMIVNKAVAGSNDGFGIGANASKPYFRIGNGGVQAAFGATVIPTSGVWSHLAGTLSGTGAGSLLVYLNGAQDGSGTATTTIPSTSTNFHIGAFQSGSQMFDGRIAEVGVWNVKLSAAEILALSKGASPLTVRKSGLVAYYPMWGSASDASYGYPYPDFSGNLQNIGQSGTPDTRDHAPVGPFAGAVLL